jgi:hypothetical protein
MIERLWPLMLTVCLCACTDPVFQERTDARAVAPFFFSQNKAPLTPSEIFQEQEQETFRPMQDLNLASQEDEWDARKNLSLGYSASEPAIPAGCSIKDRFDRKAVLAYNFDDKQSRLALHLNADADWGEVEVEKVMVKYTYKLQPIPHRKDACKYPSGFQGIIGSGYNEFFRREKNTVWDQLRDENPLGLFD